MKRKVESALAIAAALLVLVSSYSPAAAIPNYSAVGFKIGDTATYAYSTNMPGSINKTTRAEVVVLGINRTQITYIVSFSFPNSSYYNSYRLTENLSKYVMAEKLFIWAVPANLSVGDPLKEGLIYKVNQTFSASILGTQRTLNNVSFMSSGKTSYDWYDRATGFMVLHLLYIGSGQWENMTLISTTAWTSPTTSPSAPISWPEIILGLAGGIVIGVVIGFIIKRKK